MGENGYLDHRLECPYCQTTIRLRIPDNVEPDTPISGEDCGEYLGSWDELLTDLEQQGGTSGVFQLEKGRIGKIG
jgi:hypothetical protein